MTVAAPRSALALRAPDSEKITINLGFVDLGHIDLLVAEGVYSNRTDFIRTAIRTQLATQTDVLREFTTRRTLVLGIHHFGVAELQAACDAKQKLQIRVLGLASIAPDVPPTLAQDAIASITVLGALHASPAVRHALADRIA